MNTAVYIAYKNNDGRYWFNPAPSTYNNVADPVIGDIGGHGDKAMMSGVLRDIEELCAVENDKLPKQTLFDALNEAV